MTDPSEFSRRLISQRRGLRRTALYIAIIFSLVSVAWVVGTDYLIQAMALDGNIQRLIESGKGVAYVLLAATLIYLLIARHERRLRHNEKLFESVLEVTRTPVFLRDSDGHYQYVNRAAARMVGREPGEIIGLTPRDLFGREEADKILAHDGQVLRKGEPDNMEMVLAVDGAYSRYRVDKTPIWGEERNPIGLVAVTQDLTGLDEVSDRLWRSNRALRMLTRCHEAMLSQDHETDFMDRVCALIREHGGYSLVWSAYRDEPMDHRSREHMVMNGEAGDFSAWLRQQPGDIPERQAISAGQAVLNTAMDAGTDRWARLAVEAGLRAVIALPLADTGRPFGVLAIYAGRDDVFDEEEQALLRGLARDLAFALRSRGQSVERGRLLEQQVATAAKLQTALVDTIGAMARTLEKRDPYTAGHQRRVADLAVAIGRYLGLSEHRLQGLSLGAAIHDIGKIYVPAEILNRPGKLSAEEFALIKTHPVVGHDILKGVDFPWPIADMVLQHHERVDGTGYPAGLKGEQILMEARILAVADVVEAITAHRPYRPALGIEAGLDIVKHGRGTMFDPEVTDACITLVESGAYRFPKE